MYRLLAPTEPGTLSPLRRDVVGCIGLVGREALVTPLLDISRSLGRLIKLEGRAARVAIASALASINAASSSSVAKALEIRGGEGVRSRIRLTLALDMAAAGTVLVVAMGERGALIIVIHATAVSTWSGMRIRRGRKQAAKDELEGVGRVGVYVPSRLLSCRQIGDATDALVQNINHVLEKVNSLRSSC